MRGESLGGPHPVWDKGPPSVVFCIELITDCNYDLRGVNNLPWLIPLELFFSYLLLIVKLFAVV
jgi:hypothetical protein